MRWREASSVILLNPEIRHVLMMKRGPTARFMPNSYVFPGGLLEQNVDISFPRDYTNFNLVDMQPIQMKGHVDDYAFRIAALRELFEEAGLLLTFQSNCRESKIITKRDDPSLEEWRKKVLEQPQKFSELFSASNQADVNLLIPWSNWLTPASYKKRFDTMFFAALIDHSDDIEFCKAEMEEAVWIHPTDVIKKSAGLSECSLPPPQFYELARIRLAHGDSLIQHANPRRICPQTARATDDPTLFCAFLPEDHLYNTIDAESVGLRELPKKEIIPTKDIDDLRAIHRLTFRSEPPYTGHELHLSNLSMMPSKPHLFYFIGSNVNDFP